MALVMSWLNTFSAPSALLNRPTPATPISLPIIKSGAATPASSITPPPVDKAPNDKIRHMTRQPRHRRRPEAQAHQQGRERAGQRRPNQAKVAIATPGQPQGTNKLRQTI